MSKKIVATASAPAAIGPYSQAVEAGGFLFVSGQVPLDPATGGIVSEDIREQTRRSLESVKGIVEAAGATLADVVKCSVFLADMNDFAAMNEVYSEYFTGDFPARAAVEVSRLPKDVKVEIEAIAKLP